MKRVFLLAIALVAFVSCGKESTLCQTEILLDYSLPESGSMSRGGAEIYADFYNKYISSRKLTPTTYSLTFTNKSDQSKVEINDLWSKNNALKLIAGTYKVEGYSRSTERDSDGGIDTLYLTFNEEIKIEANTKKIVLNAIYDCSMLFFDAEGVKEAYYYYGTNNGYSRTRDLASLDQIYYCFAQTINTATDEIRIKKITGSAKLGIGKMNIQKGKYYYFGNAESDYNIPKMDEGI